MTEQELLKHLKEVYKEAIRELPLNYIDALEYLKNKNLEFGICWYCDKVLDIDIVEYEWYRRIRDESVSAFWVTPPYLCFNMYEVLYSLNRRLNILEEVTV